MLTIYKYPVSMIGVGEKFSLDMPRDCRILSVQEQNGKMTIWAMVDPAQPVVKIPFRIIGTGWKVDGTGDDPADLLFIDTVQMPDGLVWHVFLESATNVSGF